MNVERYQKRTKLEFEIEFITPTFLGGADGNAEIRTAPFKNLIRRWWRIVNGTLSKEKLWKKECELFGSAADKISSKSKVDLNIISDSTRVSNEQLRFGTVPDPKREGVQKMVATYLGYGAVGKRSYIMPGGKLTMALELPEQYKKEMIQILYCIDLFETIGAKSRNAFGSIAVKPKQNSFSFDGVGSLMAQDFAYVTSENCKNNYPFSLVFDEKGLLIWQTKQEFTRYEDLMNFLCDNYVTVKNWLKGDDESGWEKLFGYADTKSRLPSLVGLKVHKEKDGKLRGFFVFIPYQVKNWDPDDFFDAAMYLKDDCFDGSRAGSLERFKIDGAK